MAGVEPAFSILERIVGVETVLTTDHTTVVRLLSVSSNGSLGLKPISGSPGLRWLVPFSILERIVGVETAGVDRNH